jgi:hypothetical protein
LLVAEVNWPHFEKSWTQELQHQVPVLEAVEGFYAELLSVLSKWLPPVKNV